MITLRKLASLKEGTRRRKYPLILQSFEFDIKNGNTFSAIYFCDLLQMIWVQLNPVDFYAAESHL